MLEKKSLYIPERIMKSFKCKETERKATNVKIKREIKMKEVPCS